MAIYTQNQKRKHNIINAILIFLPCVKTQKGQLQVRINNDVTQVPYVSDWEDKWQKAIVKDWLIVLHVFKRTLPSLTNFSEFTKKKVI